MKNTLIVLAVIIIAILLIAFLGGDRAEVETLTLEESREIAENWVMENSPTYTFDGSNLSLEEEMQLEDCQAEDCFEFTFSFESSSAGYGDRTDEVTAQVITSHTMEVVVEGGEVTSAVTDETYSEFDAMMLSEMEEASEEDSMMEGGEMMEDGEAMEEDGASMEMPEQGSPETDEMEVMGEKL